MNSTITTFLNFTSEAAEVGENISVPVKIVLVTILLTCSAVGSIGNILIIYAVVNQPALRKLTGNFFICNLAIADLIVTALLLPVTAGNIIINNKSILPDQACRIVGFLLSLSCNASMQNLMFISLQRLMVTSADKNKMNLFKKRYITIMLAVFVWAWSAMLVAPTLARMPANGETLLVYDTGATMCAWDDVSEPRFPFSLVILAFVVPLLVSLFCYYILFKRVTRKSSMMSQMTTSKSVQAKMKERESRLLNTILIVLACFVISWTPYCFTVLLNIFGVMDNLMDPTVKRPLAWLGMSNSMINSFIYGWRNENFRRGYVACGLRLADAITCKRYNWLRRHEIKQQAKRRSHVIA